MKPRTTAPIDFADMDTAIEALTNTLHVARTALHKHFGLDHPVRILNRILDVQQRAALTATRWRVLHRRLFEVIDDAEKQGLMLPEECMDLLDALEPWLNPRSGGRGGAWFTEAVRAHAESEARKTP